MLTSYFRFQRGNEMGDWIRATFDSIEDLEMAISDLSLDPDVLCFEQRSDEPPEYAAQQQARGNHRALVAWFSLFCATRKPFPNGDQFALGCSRRSTERRSVFSQGLAN